MLRKRATDSGWRWSAKGDGGIAVVVDVDDRMTAGADKFGHQTTQQAKGDR
jgi:hypothetical protein